MSALVFNLGDKPFLKWMADNHNGYVINTVSRPSDWFLKVHRSNCHHISTYSKGQKDGAFTLNDYMKICSIDVTELIDWAASNNKTIESHRICKSCCPDFSLFEMAGSEEIIDSTKLPEGAMRVITVNSYERNKTARNICLKHYGYNCAVCGFNFGKVYGKEFSDFIHVHHLTPLFEIKEAYEVNPIEDLVPVCPNCHAVIHRTTETLSISQVRELLRK